MEQTDAISNAGMQQRMYDAEFTSQRHPPHELDPSRIALTRTILAELPPGKLLDVGCSDGAIIAPLRHRHELYGVDVSSESVKQAIVKGVRAKVADSETALPFDDAQFDIALAAETIEHIVRTDFFLHQINRVLRIGGYIVISTPNVGCLLTMPAMALFDMPPYMGARYRSPHVRDFTVRTLKYALRNHGFEPMRVHGAALLLPFAGAVLPSLGYRFPRLSPTMIVLARKTADSVFEPQKEFEFSLNV